MSQLPKPSKKTKKQRKIVSQVCPECGLKVFELKRHLDMKHFGEKQTCPQCNKELPCQSSLKDHFKKVHEKVPCTQCGELFARIRIKRHILSKHTPDNMKKYQCQICWKGFSVRGNYEDHMNIHTGDKPFKCKYCSECFASKGNHAMHERKHLGYRRDFSKRKRKKVKHITQCTSEPLELDQVLNVGSPPIVMIQLSRPPTPYSAISN